MTQATSNLRIGFATCSRLMLSYFYSAGLLLSVEDKFCENVGFDVFICAWHVVRRTWLSELGSDQANRSDPTFQVYMIQNSKSEGE